ncbi:MAG: UTP--glucose-1-phosphate uridylyltransferase [Candidatus Neptunochlamydia sp.]|nr:UTP--glucose-1-phosphate uridylyltransferase [Candidatus Neptunochlamydia sp.]
MTHSLKTRFNCGCLILAGGQGTRLDFNRPKGCIELPLKEKKTLFHILLQKVKDPKAPIAVMTSPLNHESTLAYLKKENFFGLENVTLFQQRMEREFPDGNGKAFTYFCQEGLWNQWKEIGIKYLQVLPVDNPLATPFDKELISANHGVDLVLRGVKRKGPDEKIGVILDGDKLQVEEYTESTHLNEEMLGNTGIFSCTLDFVKLGTTVSLPLHTVRKKIKGSWFSKKEYFIFDLFPYAKSYKVLLSEREKYFAPIKNASGPDSLESVAKTLKN